MTGIFKLIGAFLIGSITAVLAGIVAGSLLVTIVTFYTVITILGLITTIFINRG
jgi:hypothetical protein